MGTLKEIGLACLKLNYNVSVFIIKVAFRIISTLFHFILNMMMGEKGMEESMRRKSIMPSQAPKKQEPPSLDEIDPDFLPPDDLPEQPTADVPVINIEGEEGGGMVEGETGGDSGLLNGGGLLGVPGDVSRRGSSATICTETGETISDAPHGSRSALNGSASGAGAPPLPPAPAQPAQEEVEVEGEEGEDIPPLPDLQQNTVKFTGWVLSLFARNFYNFKLISLALAFFINFILLFFKASVAQEEIMASMGGGADEDAGPGLDDLLGGEEDEEDPLEWVSIADNLAYLSPFLRMLAILHTLCSFATMVAYFCLKVPLVVFKREKEICRNLEFEGKWIAEQVADDDIMGHWDKLVISTRSWPDKYWDKFVKKKVRNKYSEQYDYDQITNLLGMDKDTTPPDPKSSFLPAALVGVDWQYHIWNWGIIFTDNAFQYCVWYFAISLLGQYNYFFYCAHLLDVAVCVKTLGTILQSVTHNGKQLLLTILLLSITVYVYTVIAFNFFRKFYVQEEGDEVDKKCHDMLSCYIFHLYVGVRAGGGIGDEIESPDGDPAFVYRIIFDTTFFFFVIIILLAIVQGLIIDAFGELRDQLEQVKEDLEAACFICGIGKDYFDGVPRGFETHCMQEHNFANYMFFLMHLINKPDTEYTGQETYVWEMYENRNWDFFPVGECFRKTYEEQLNAA